MVCSVQFTNLIKFVLQSHLYVLRHIHDHLKNIIFFCSEEF